MTAHPNIVTPYRFSPSDAAHCFTYLDAVDEATRIALSFKEAVAELRREFQLSGSEARQVALAWDAQRERQT